MFGQGFQQGGGDDHPALRGQAPHGFLDDGADFRAAAPHEDPVGVGQRRQAHRGRGADYFKVVHPEVVPVGSNLGGPLGVALHRKNLPPGDEEAGLQPHGAAPGPHVPEDLASA